MILKLIKNADIYLPSHFGVGDILIADNKIVGIEKSIDLLGVEYEKIDLSDKIVTPGFIDQHVHIIGGGGQRGYSSLVPEVTISELVSCGTTTVVGLLGTDGFVKDLNTLYAKSKAIDQDGLTSFMLTSYYGLPSRTLTGSIAEDLIYIDKVIGCKLAMSDDRCSFPTEQDILRIINQVRLGGFTSGKGGILHIHLGNLPEGIDILLDIAHKYPTLIRYISPTHMIRTEHLFNQAIELAKMGGNVDFSTGGTRFKLPHLCVMDAIEKGVSIDRITFSSDGHGGVRKVNPDTGEVTYTPAPLDLNMKEMFELVKQGFLNLQDALKLITINPARNLSLKGKGCIEIGADADICIFNNQYTLTDLFSRGEIMMREKKIIKKGCYEP